MARLKRLIDAVIGTPELKIVENVEISNEVFETIKDEVVEVVGEFAKRHPGATPGVIYE